MALKYFQVILQSLIALLFFEYSSRNSKIESILEVCCRHKRHKHDATCDFTEFAKESTDLGLVLSASVVVNLVVYMVKACVANKERDVVQEAVKVYVSLIKDPLEQDDPFMENFVNAHKGRDSLFSKTVIMEMIMFGVIIVNGIVTAYVYNQCDLLFENTHCIEEYFVSADRVNFDGGHEHVLKYLFYILFCVYVLAIAVTLFNIYKTSSLYHSYKESYKALVFKQLVRKLNGRRELNEIAF